LAANWETKRGEEDILKVPNFAAENGRIRGRLLVVHQALKRTLGSWREKKSAKPAGAGEVLSEKGEQKREGGEKMERTPRKERGHDKEQKEEKKWEKSGREKAQLCLKF